MRPIFSGTLVFLFIIVVGVGCDEGMNVAKPIISDLMDSDQMELSEPEKLESQPVAEIEQDADNADSTVPDPDVEALPVSEQTVVYVTPAEVESPSIGESFMVSINVTNGVSVAGYQVTVNFDPTAIRYVSNINADYLPAGAYVAEPRVTDSGVRILAVAYSTAPEGDGTLATVTFEVVQEKASTIQLTEVQLVDAKGNFLPHITADGEVTDAVQNKE